MALSEAGNRYNNFRKQPMIRTAEPDDVAALTRLARTVFRETYGAVIPNTILTSYLDRTFSPTMFHTMVADPAITLLVATMNERIGGYGKLRSAPIPSNATNAVARDGASYAVADAANDATNDMASDAAVELSTLYIDRRYRGNGFGKMLMTEALLWSARQGYATMWLCVWQENQWAQAFYEQLGFAIIGTTEIMVEDVIFHDWIMRRPTIAADTTQSSQAAM